MTLSPTARRGGRARRPRWRPALAALLVAAALLLLATRRWRSPSQFQASDQPPQEVDAPLPVPTAGASAAGAAVAAAAATGQSAFLRHWQRVKGPDSQLSRPPAPAGERSHFLPFIHKDLARWRQAGISQGLVEAAVQRVKDASGWAAHAYWIRFQILGGKLYVEHWTPQGGHYPAELGRGWVSAKARVPYAILAIVDVMHHFPGSLPNMDVIVSTMDTPCSVLGDGNSVPPPIFGYTGAAWAADIPWPDMTYYGHEVGILNDDKGRWLWGWQAQLDHYARKWAQPLWDRSPRMVWRGRAEHGDRDAVRKEFSECPVQYREANDSRSAALFSTATSGDAGPVDLDSMCRYMFQAYLESKAYSSNCKQKLACGSLFLAPQIEYWEFWTRGLEPGRHYLPFDAVPPRPNATLCDKAATTARSVLDYLFSAPAQGHAATAARGGGQQQPPQQRAEPEAAEQQDQAQLQKQEVAAVAGRQQQLHPQGEQEVAPVEGEPQRRRRGLGERGGKLFPWGSELTPQEIADGGRKFLQQHVTMRDVRLYLRDVLIEYAALLQFKPAPSQYARCYTGQMLLQEFAIPFKEDAAEVAEAYPWLAAWDPGCPKQRRGWLWG